MLLHPPQMLPVCRGTEEALKEAGLLLKGPEKQSLLIWRTETSLLLRNKTLGEPKRLLPSFLPSPDFTQMSQERRVLPIRSRGHGSGTSNPGCPVRVCQPLSSTPPKPSAAASLSSQLMAQAVM